ncbi:MAG TPA: hypothetical protein VN807_07595 [Candidatus Sulfotelmatobacter sp.]|nr:hypothetical protein [Candidatus Sulfotelmatobacter sp.]
METVVWVNPSDVDVALARLGLRRSPLWDAILAGLLERSNCTENDAPNVPGFIQWARTLRVLRERLILEDWVKSDSGRYYTVVRADGKVAIAVASGSEDTGREDGFPRNRSAKGPSTATIVSQNAGTIDLFPETLPPPTEVVDPERATYLLLFYVCPSDVRAELSLPVDIDDDGYITAWRERIILGSHPIDSAAIEISGESPDAGPDIDVDVKRRA